MNKQWVCTEIDCDAMLQDDLAAEVAEAFGVSVEFIDKGIRFYLEGDALSAAHEEELQRIFQYYESIPFPGFRYGLPDFPPSR